MVEQSAPDEEAAASDNERRSVKSQKSLTPAIGDLSFCTFTFFLLILFGFALFTDIVLCSVSIRADSAEDDGSIRFSFGPAVKALNYVWIIGQVALLLDLLVTYYRYFRPAGRPNLRRRISGSSDFEQPMCWTGVSKLFRVDLLPRGFLLLLSILLPLNALFFYKGLGYPVYIRSELAQHGDHRAFGSEVSAWESSGNVKLDIYQRTVLSFAGTNLTTPLQIQSNVCYAPDSAEFQILGFFQSESMPKQAYCETLLGTLMVGWRKEIAPGSAWQHDEDVWDESFEFSLRLFSSLAGVIADQSDGHAGFWFLKDMTDVFDMFLMTSADVEQMHEGRPLLTAWHGVSGTEYEYHDLVCTAMWIGTCVVMLRALAIIGFQPIVRTLSYCCSCCATVEKTEARRVVDATLSMFFIEIPFLMLRWIAWWQYGVPVSVMAVKNVFGIYEDLHILGLVGGFSPQEMKPRICRGCLKRKKKSDESEKSPEPPEGAEPERPSSV